jgi:hypothetical protein
MMALEVAGTNEPLRKASRSPGAMAVEMVRRAIAQAQTGA